MRRQRGSIAKKGDVFYFVFRTPEKKQKWVGPFQTRHPLDVELNEILVEINRGTYVDPSPSPSRILRKAISPAAAVFAAQLLRLMLRSFANIWCPFLGN